MNYKPTPCKTRILLKVKPVHHTVNKIGPFCTYYMSFFTDWITYYHSAYTQLPHCRISTLSHLTTVENYETRTPPFFVIL